MRSLHDLDHLSALFMKDSSIRAQNKATAPVEGFGTRDNPGLIQVWILSLGIQKRSVSTATRTRRVAVIQNGTTCNQVYTL